MMTPDELSDAARKLAHGLGIPVYIRDGRIYQNGPGVEFLPTSGARPIVAGAPSLEEGKANQPRPSLLLFALCVSGISLLSVL